MAKEKTSQEVSNIFHSIMKESVKPKKLKIKNMQKEHGIIVYDIHPDGCLNGVYSDEVANNRIYNEILRKKSTDNNGKLSGKYLFASMDINDSIVCGEVIITEKNGFYTIEWFDDKGRNNYEGTGWKTKENQLAVSYRLI